MSLVVCLFLQLFFSVFWSDAQLTTSDRDCKQTNPCPAGFNYGGNGVNKCYAVVLQPMNWDAAQEKCREMNPKAHLTIINSPLENQIISEILNEHDCHGSSDRNWFWTSGHRQNTNCSYPLVWKSNPRNNQAVGYTNWCPGEPSCAIATASQHCLTFAKSCFSNQDINGWQDDACSNNQCPICEVLRV